MNYMSVGTPEVVRTNRIWSNNILSVDGTKVLGHYGHVSIYTSSIVRVPISSMYR